MITVALTPDFVATLTDLLRWPHRIVITRTVGSGTVAQGTVVVTPIIEFRLFTVTVSFLGSGKNKR